MKQSRLSNLALPVFCSVLLTAPFMLGGCVASRAAAYQAHLDARVEPGRSESPDVAVAFGLDGFGPTDERLASAVSDDEAVSQP